MRLNHRALLIISLITASAFAGRNGSSVIRVDTLPLVLRSACYEAVVLQKYDDTVAMELYGQTENPNDLYLARTVKLQGTMAHKVKNVEVTVFKSGWFPKCGVTIR